MKIKCFSSFLVAILVAAASAAGAPKVLEDETHTKLELSDGTDQSRVLSANLRASAGRSSKHTNEEIDEDIGTIDERRQDEERSLHHYNQNKTDHQPDPWYTCPKKIAKFHPEPRNQDDKNCARGGTCNVFFGLNSKVKYDVLDVTQRIDQQKAYLKRLGMTMNSAKFFDGLFEGICAPSLTGAECFVDTCHNNGGDVFYFLKEFNKVPFQNELEELCTCFLTGGTDCLGTCGCNYGQPNTDIAFAMNHKFCRCYCACCDSPYD